jgi:uncharacterized protein YmfQ (DUF2313 family)
MLKSLLLRGSAWTARIGSTMSDFLQVFANELELLGDRVTDAIAEAFTLTATETLPDWEEEYGIIPGQGSDAERQARLQAKKYPRVGNTWNRGQSIPFIYSMFLAAGWNIPVDGTPSTTDPHVEIVEHPCLPFRVGISKIGDALYWGTGYSVFTVIIKGTDMLVTVNGVDVPNPLLSAIFGSVKARAMTYQGDAAVICSGGNQLPAHAEFILVNE